MHANFLPCPFLWTNSFWITPIRNRGNTTYVNLTCSNNENYSMAAPNPSKQIPEVAKVLQQHWKRSLKIVLKIYKMTIIFLIKSQGSVSNMWVINCKWNWEMTSLLVRESIWLERCSATIWGKTNSEGDKSMTCCLPTCSGIPLSGLPAWVWEAHLQLSFWSYCLQLPPPVASGLPASKH